MKGESGAVRRARRIGAASALGMGGIAAVAVADLVRNDDAFEEDWNGFLIEGVALGLWLLPYLLFAFWLAALMRVTRERGEGAGLPSALGAGLGMFFFPATLGLPVRALLHGAHRLGARAGRPILFMFASHAASFGMSLVYLFEPVSWWEGVIPLIDAATLLGALASVVIVARVDRALRRGSAADVFA